MQGYKSNKIRLLMHPSLHNICQGVLIEPDYALLIVGKGATYTEPERGFVLPPEGLELRDRLQGTEFSPGHARLCCEMLRFLRATMAAVIGAIFALDVEHIHRVVVKHVSIISVLRCDLWLDR